MIDFREAKYKNNIKVWKPGKRYREKCFVKKKKKKRKGKKLHIDIHRNTEFG